MDLHPYDGVTRRFRHDDADQTIGLEIVRRLLPAPWTSIVYDMSFYSGGVGIIDSVHISAAMDPAPILKGMLPWTQAGEDILWLIGADEETPPETALRQFVAEHKAPFQPSPTDLNVWFEPESGVNWWVLVYVEGGLMHYLSYDQG